MGHSRRCRWVGHWEDTAALTDSSIAAADCVPTYLHDRGWHPHGCAGTTAAARWRLRLGLADGASVPERAHRDDRARAVHLPDSAYRIVRRGLGMRDGKPPLSASTLPPPRGICAPYMPPSKVPPDRFTATVESGGHRRCEIIQRIRGPCVHTHPHPPPPPPPPAHTSAAQPGELSRKSAFVGHCRRLGAEYAALTLPGEPEDDRVRRLGGMVLRHRLSPPPSKKIGKARQGLIGASEAVGPDRRPQFRSRTPTSR